MEYEYEEFHEELEEIKELLNEKKSLIKTPEMQKFYYRVLHDLKWLQIEVEEELES